MTNWEVHESGGTFRAICLDCGWASEAYFSKESAFVVGYNHRCER